LAAAGAAASRRKTLFYGLAVAAIICIAIGGIWFFLGAAPEAALASAGLEETAALLEESEAASGHTIARHVGDAKSLVARLAKYPRRTIVSAFSSEQEAKAAIDAALRLHSAEIEQWISGESEETLAFNSPFSGGSVLKRGATSVVRGREVRIVLQRIEPHKFIIKTAYLNP
jgi:hypothetical protein